MVMIPKQVIGDNKELMAEWDYEKNNVLSLDPFSLGVHSHTKVWWKCKEGHSWCSSINNRTRKGHMNGCPYCAHQLPISGETDLATLYPELAKQWHPTKNKLTPSEVMPGTHKKAWWICDKNHEWEAEVKSRTTGVGCPYCSNKKVLKGFNDLATINPDLAKEWHPVKNGNLTPSDVTPSSGKKVWWKCSFGHEWEAQICNRNAGRGCPECSDSLRTSFPEQAIYYYIKQVFPDAVSSYKEIFRSSMELDIFIPSLKVGIEYDGKTYHSDSKNQLRDAKKYKICKENGIILIRIREMSRYSPIIMCDHKIEIPDASDKYLNWAINNLCYHLGKIVMPDVRKDRYEILRYLNNKKESLASVFPEVAAEWDYEENYPLIPENFPPHSNERVGWKCNICGYKWKAAIGDRTGDDMNGCPVCAKKRGGTERVKSLVKKNGSLASLYPELLEEWDFEKNNIIGLDPYNITPGSGKKANWICKKCGYSWSATINHRIHGRNCPFCAGKVVISGKNDLATLKPELLKEWNYDKNNKIGLDPTKLPIRTAKKAFWICSVCENRWSASICSRSAGSGCPEFRKHPNQKKIMKVNYYQTELIPNENSLAKKYPEIANEWDYEKNGEYSPDMFSYSSNQKVWWKCNKGHEWKAAIGARTGKAHSGCPVCSNRIVQKGYNDLLSQNPELAKQWDKEKNGDMKPDQVIVTSPKKVWWICDKGHSFEAKIYDRNKKNQGCPYCSNQRFKSEYNSLAVLRPDLAEEWDYEKNYPLTPKDVLCGGDKKYWWKCRKEPHSYLQNIGDRIQKGSQCPYCSSQKLLKGFNDLAAKKPELLKIWNYPKNKDVQPDEVMEFSNRKVWWKCPDCGHEWKTSVSLVSAGSRCPKCSDVYKVSEPEQIIYYYLSQYFSDTEITAHREWLKNREIDVFIPSINLAIEYDGAFWHKKVAKRDLEKSKVILENGNSLIRIREDQLGNIEDGSFAILVPTSPYDYSRLSEPIEKIFEWINENRGLSIIPDIDVDRDWKRILASEKRIRRERSIVVTNPDVAKYWNYDRNQGLKPDQVFAGSNKKVWWKCPECGYEWESIVTNMVVRGAKCPVCIIKERQRISSAFNQKDSVFNDQDLEYKSPRMIIGLNDLKTLRKDIADEWNYEKNGNLRPEFFSVGSSRRVWWKCSMCGHEWKTSVANRTYGFGCPKCGKKKAAESSSHSRVIPGTNDFATINPIAASQWNYEKNGNLKPDSLTANSNLKVWWKCFDCGNEWQAVILSRKKSKDCPFCNNRRFKEGFNDIFSKKPELKQEWDYKKNDTIDPLKTICSSHDKVWWKCPDCGHEWKTTIYSRYRGSGCPICSHAEGFKNRTKRLTKEGNSFGNLFPDISKEWLNEKNAGITPFDITAHNGKKFWWKCSKCGYEWQATPNHRAQGTGCPKCKDIENGKKKRIKVINVDTGEIFDSLSDAATKYGTTASAISYCCSGKTKKSAGHHWKFIGSSEQNY